MAISYIQERTGSSNRSPDPLAGFKGPYFKEEEEGKGKKGKENEERECKEVIEKKK